MGSPDVTMCNYVQVCCKIYLHILTAVCVTILLYFCKRYLHILRRFPRQFLRRFRRLRGRIAVAAPLHHSIASAPHRVTARNAGDLPTSLVHVRLKPLSDGHCFMVDFYPFIRLIVYSQVCINQLSIQLRAFWYIFLFTSVMFIVHWEWVSTHR